MSKPFSTVAVIDLLRNYDYEITERDGKRRLVELHGDFSVSVEDLDIALHSGLCHFLRYTLGAFYGDMWTILKNHGEHTRLFNNHEDIESAIQYLQHYNDLFNEKYELDGEDEYTPDNDLPF